MSSPVSDPWTTNHAASPSTPDTRKQRRTWHAATPHKANSPDSATPSLKITHFTKKVIVCFDVVKVGKTKKRTLKLINPHDYPQVVELERISPKKGFYLEEKAWDVPPGETLTIPIFWTPPDDGNFRDLITFLCEGAFRLQVILLGTAEETKKVSTRRSTFLVKRQSTSKPLRPKNTSNMKIKRQSMLASSNGVGKENKVNRKSVGKPSLNGTKDRQAGTDRGTPLGAKTNGSVTGKSRVLYRGRHLKRLDITSQPNEVHFDEKTTSQVLNELSGAEEPVKNIAVENVARETLLVCEGMSPLLKSKKFEWNGHVTSPCGSPRNENVMKTLKGTEIKARSSDGFVENSLTKLSRKTLFTDTKDCSFDASEMQKAKDEDEVDIHTPGSSDITDDSLETVDDGADTSNIAEDADGINDDIVSTFQASDVDGIQNTASSTGKASDSVEDLVDEVVSSVQVTNVDVITDNTACKTLKASDNADCVVDDTISILQPVDVEGSINKAASKTENVSGSDSAATDFVSDATIDDGDIADQLQGKNSEEPGNKEEEHPTIPAVDESRMLDSEGVGGWNPETTDDEEMDEKLKKEKDYETDENVEELEKTENGENVMLTPENSGGVEDEDHLKENFEEREKKGETDERETEKEDEVRKTDRILMEQNSLNDENKTEGEDLKPFAALSKSVTGDVSSDVPRLADSPSGEGETSVVDAVSDDAKGETSVIFAVSDDAKTETSVMDAVTDDAKGETSVLDAVSDDAKSETSVLDAVSDDAKTETSVIEAVSDDAKTETSVLEAVIDETISVEEDKVEKTGLMFIPLDEDTSVKSTGISLGGNKRVVEDSDMGDAKGTKKPRLADQKSSVDRPAGKGRKSSLSLNRTVALRKAAATNSSVSTAPRTKPKVKKIMKGVPMAKLNLVKPTRTALPRHPMPFAAKNMFYDERWLDKQERGFVQWLNYVLTPEDVGNRNPTIKGTKIEASTLAVSSSSTTIKRAPTKEVLSLRAYTARRRLNQLRRASCLLFQSEPVVRVIQKLEALVENRGLTVRSDRKIHADLGMKQNILLMILCYNPLWLRIGLETIYGELLPVEDNSDIVGLSRFIVTRLLGNPDIAALYAHPTVPALFRPGYEETLAKFTLKKFLLLVFFLDKAKLTRLIDHDPCLFCKDAQYKSSRDLLLEFSRLYLKGEGDITRHLNYIGFSVTHTQKALDEYDFAVVNLAKDLRDGVRLVRVTELLTKNWLLSHDLRCPAISRLQKIHNVQVALKALSQSTDISGCGVDAKSIVEGHREKTLQLLWSIIFSFKVETMLDEAKLKEETTFLWSNLKLKRKLDAVRMLSSYKSAGHGQEGTNVYFKSGKLSLLLKWCQAVCAYYSVQVENFTVSFCDGRVLCYLVHHYHPELLPLSVINNTTTQTEDQKVERNDGSENGSFDGTWARSYSPTTGKESTFDQLIKNEQQNFKTLYQAIQNLGGVPFMIKSMDMSGTIPDEKVVITYTSYLCARLLDLCHETRAVRTIQMAWRNYQLRKQTEHLKTLNRAATVIQLKIREYLRRRHLKRREEAVITLQTAVRGWMARRKLLALRRDERRRQEDAAVVILQSHVRRLQAQRLYRNQLRALVKIQAMVRGRRVRRDVMKMKKAVLLIEDHYTAHKERQEMQQRYRQTKQAVITIQAFYRGLKARRLYREMKAARIIQSRWKGCICRRRYQSMKNATVLIQSVWRMYCEEKQYREMKIAARKIQDWYRAIQLRDRERSLYLAKLDAVRKIQALCRGLKTRRLYERRRSSCVLIQATVRSYLVRKRYQRIRLMTIRIQRQHRAYLQAREECQRYRDLKEATTTIQAYLRGWLARKQMDKERQAACLIQSHVRVLIQRKLYTATRQACITLQCNVRCYQQRQRYLTLKRSVLIIQRVFRGHLAWTHVKAVRSAVKIQATYRMYRARRQYQADVADITRCQATLRSFIIHRRYVRLQTATRAIQKHLRGWLEMRRMREEYSVMKLSCTTIQSAYRGYVIRRQYMKTRSSIILCQSLVRAFLEKKRFKEKQNAAIIIQRRYRAHQAEKTCRAIYCQQRQACIVLQTSFRKYLCRKRFLTLRSAAVLVQSYWRMVLTRERYQATQAACRTIQKRWREVLVARQQRNNYVQMRHAAVVFQRFYRGLRARRYVKYIRSIVICQSAIRRFITQQRYNKQRNAAIKIQAFIRGKMTQQRYLRQRAAVLILQERWRSTLRCRHDYLMYHVQRGAVITLQSAARGWFVRKDLKKAREAAVIIQSMYRRHRARKDYYKTQEAVLTLQRFTRAYIKGRTARKQYLVKRQAAVSIQAWWRMQQRQGEYTQMRRAAITLQAGVRMMLQRRQYQQDRSLIIKMQQRWRAKRLGDEEKRRYLEMRRATITLQAWVRGMAVRNRVQSWHQSATKIEACWRGFRERRAFLVQRSAVVIIQRRFRAQQSMRIKKKEYQELRMAVVTVQAMYRGMQGRRRAQRHKAARLIQATYKMYRLRTEFKKCRRAAVLLQATFRCNRQHKTYLRMKQAARVLQKCWRLKREGRMEVEKYQKMRKAVVIVQSAVRGWIVRKKYMKARQSAITIQSVYRRYRAVKSYQKTRDLVIKTQRRWRAQKLAQVEKKWYLEMRAAAVTLQAWSRGMAVRKEVKTWHLNATKITAHWRGFRERRAFLVQRSVVIKIQRRFRAYQCMRKEMREYQKLRKATVTIQAMYRGMHGRRLAQKHRAARLVQATYRMYRLRTEFKKLKRAAVLLQATFRCNRQHKTYLRMKQAARVLQKCWRLKREGRIEAEKYQKTRQAVVIVQSAVRGWIVRKRFMKARQSAIMIQSVYRRYRAVKSYQKTRDLVIKTQRRWKAKKLAQVEKKRYLEMKRAAVTLQAWSRGMAVRKEVKTWHLNATKITAHWRGFRERRAFLVQRSAVIKIQRQFRAYQCMRKEMREYQELRRAAVTVQAMYRGMQGRRRAQRHKAARLIQATYKMYRLQTEFKKCKKAAVLLQAAFRAHKCRTSYQQTRSAVIVLQQHVRAYLNGRCVRAQLRKEQNAAIVIQTYYRRYTCRKNYTKQREAAVTLQSVYRCHRQQKHYREMRSAAGKFQTYWRAKMMMKRQKAEYQRMRDAAIVMQASVRCYLIHERYLKMREAAITIQTAWRSFHARRTFVAERKAATIIQRRYRAQRMAKERRTAYIEMKSASITIQNVFRTYRCRKQFNEKKSAAVVIQAWFRGYQCLKKYQSQRKATVVIQRWYRNILLTRRIKREYEVMSWAALRVQSIWRGNRDRKRVKQLRWGIAVAKERLEALIKIQNWTRSRLERMRFVRLRRAALLAQRLYRKRYQNRVSAVIVLQKYCRMWLTKRRLDTMQSAALTIQSIWRGRKVRVSVKSKKVERARARCMKACKAATEDKKLCNRTTSGLHFLLTYKHLHQVVEAVCSLEVATRLSARCCERLVAGQAVPVLFRLIKNCNRSLPCMEVIKYVVATLVNLAKYTPTAPSVLECPDAVTSILDLMMIYRETNPVIFTKAVMLLTVLAQEEKLQKILLATPKIDEKLRSLLNLQERKLKLKTRQMIAKSKSQGMTVPHSQLMTPSKRKRPIRSFQPDWVLGKSKRQDLEDPIEALRCLMGALNMKC